MKEIWKDIPNYEGLYQASNLGNIKSLERKIFNNSVYGGYSTIKEKILKPHLHPNGYCSVKLSKNGKINRVTVHRLIALCFIENPENKPQVNHIDGNKQNNRTDNLEYCTVRENHLHAYRTGLHVATKRKCIQKDLSGNIIKIWDSFKQIREELGYDDSAIIKCCKKKQKTSYHYIWEYVE